MSATLELSDISNDVFWQKPKFWTRIEKERAVVVATKGAQTSIPGQKAFEINGAGLVSAPLAKAFHRMTQYQDWTAISDLIQAVEYSKNDTEPFLLKVVLRVFNDDYELPLVVDTSLKEDQGVGRWKFEVRSGRMKGLSGFIDFKRQGRSTRMALKAVYQAEELRVPPFFFKKGVEVVSQVIAKRMRAYIEKD